MELTLSTRGGSASASFRETSSFSLLGTFRSPELSLTPSIYHRFTVDENNTITAMRLFQDEPKWTPYSRSEPGTDDRAARKDYVQSIPAAA